MVSTMDKTDTQQKLKDMEAKTYSTYPIAWKWPYLPPSRKLHTLSSRLETSWKVSLIICCWSSSFWNQIIQVNHLLKKHYLDSKVFDHVLYSVQGNKEASSICLLLLLLWIYFGSALLTNICEVSYYDTTESCQATVWCLLAD